MRISKKTNKIGKSHIIQINVFLFLEKKRERETKVQKDQIQSSNPIIYLLLNTSFYPFQELSMSVFRSAVSPLSGRSRKE